MITTIKASAGSGKTHTIVRSALRAIGYITTTEGATQEQLDIYNHLMEEHGRLSPGRIAMAAHSTSVRDKLKQDTFDKVHVSTIHGLGHAAVTLAARKRGMPVVGSRLNEFVEIIEGRPLNSLPRERKGDWYTCHMLAKHFKIELLDPTPVNLEYLANKYPIITSKKLPSNWENDVSELLVRSLSGPRLTFDDQIFRGGHVAHKPKYDLLFVDEATDLSKSMYKLLTRIAKNIVFIGDANQNIMGFMGASEEVFASLDDVSDAIMPLRTTFRCPKDICTLANEIRPNSIIHGPNDNESEIKTISTIDLDSYLSTLPYDKTLTLCRTNAQVFATTLRLYTSGLECRIINRDFAKEFIKFIKSFYPSTVQELNRKLDHYLDSPSNNKNRYWKSICEDKVAAVRQLCNQFGTLAKMYDWIETTNNKKVGHPVSTVHRAKGLEADNVFICVPITLDFLKEDPITAAQEINCEYVAVTRSSRNLYYVSP